MRLWLQGGSLILCLSASLGIGIESESEVTQSCLTLWDPMDCSPPGSSVLGILQARVLEWVTTSFSRGSSWPRDQTQGSNPGLLHCRQMLYSHQGSLYYSTSYLIMMSAAAAAKSLQSSNSVQPQRRQPTRLPRAWDSAGKNTGMKYYSAIKKNELAEI